MLMVEHFENNSHLIFEEIRRWRYLLWDEWIEYKQEVEYQKKRLCPHSIHTSCNSQSRFFFKSTSIENSNYSK